MQSRAARPNGGQQSLEFDIAMAADCMSSAAGDRLKCGESRRLQQFIAPGSARGQRP
jgi:hypothetical protein